MSVTLVRPHRDSDWRGGLIETLQLRVWGYAGSVTWGCGRTKGLFERLPSCLAGACARAPGEERA